MMIIMMIMLMPSVFSGTYLMIIMRTSILYLMNLLLAFISNKITPMFNLDVVIQFRAWRPVLNPSRVQRWRCHHYHNHHHHRHCYHHHRWWSQPGVWSWWQSWRWPMTMIMMTILTMIMMTMIMMTIMTMIMMTRLKYKLAEDDASSSGRWVGD